MTAMTSAAQSRPLPKSYLSEERRNEILRSGDMELVYIVESREAREANDMDAAWAWLALAEVPAYTLKRLKESRGAQFIRDFGFNTRTADEKYGAGWLDRT